MTDKEIIIDGCNVRDCACIIEDYYYQQANNLENGYKHIKNVCELGETGSEYYNLFCKDNPNCNYKQLKRKERECEELKHKVELMMDCASCKIDEYRQALDEIEYYINNQGINNKWNMRIQKFRMGILDIINKVKGVKQSEEV